MGMVQPSAQRLSANVTGCAVGSRSQWSFSAQSLGHKRFKDGGWWIMYDHGGGYHFRK